MGQNQSAEINDKTLILSSPSDEIVVSSALLPTNNDDLFIQKENDSSRVSNNQCNYYKDELSNNSSLFTFISGFYQSPGNPHHIFFNLSYDDVCRIAEYSKNWKVIPYTGDPNEKGIIHWIGCLNEKREYINPFKQDMIRILTSRDYHVNYSRNESSVFRVFEYPNLVDKDCYFDPGCIVFHFPNHMIHPTGYTFRNGGGRGSVVRRWVLEAANDVDGPWTSISCHPNDDTFFYDVTDGQNKEKSFLPHCWEIPSNTQQRNFYSFFRLQSLHTHPNGRSHALYISGFELFGTVRWNRK